MDFLPTKGIEYLMVIGYLLLLIPFWWALKGGSARRPASTPARAAVGAAARKGAPGLRGWFRVPEGVLFHPGHTWAVPEGSHVMRIGVDDFAQLLVGPPDSIRLPAAGSALEIGERGFGLGADAPPRAVRRAPTASTSDTGLPPPTGNCPARPHRPGPSPAQRSAGTPPSPSVPLPPSGGRGTPPPVLLQALVAHIPIKLRAIFQRPRSSAQTSSSGEARSSTSGTAPPS